MQAGAGGFDAENREVISGDIFTDCANSRSAIIPEALNNLFITFTEILKLDIDHHYRSLRFHRLLVDYGIWRNLPENAPLRHLLLAG